VDGRGERPCCLLDVGGEGVNDLLTGVGADLVLMRVLYGGVFVDI